MNPKSLSKKLIASITGLLLALTLTPASQASVVYEQASTCSLSGAGTQSDPYLVGTESDLAQFAVCESGSGEIHFEQTANIYLDASLNYPAPDVNSGSGFIYDGKNFGIIGFNLDTTSTGGSVEGGLFGSYQGSGSPNVEVKNLLVVAEKVSVSNSSVTNYSNVGTLFSRLEGVNFNIDNVQVQVGTVLGSRGTGGLIGEIYNSSGVINNTHVLATTIKDTGYPNLGGLIGQIISDSGSGGFSVTISNSSVQADVLSVADGSSVNSNRTGGFVGSLWNTKLLVQKSRFSGNIASSVNSYKVGGVVGAIEDTDSDAPIVVSSELEIEDTVVDATISAGTIGGFVGYAEQGGNETLPVTISNSIIAGNLKNLDPPYINASAAILGFSGQSTNLTMQGVLVDTDFSVDTTSSNAGGALVSPDNLASRSITDSYFNQNKVDASAWSVLDNHSSEGYWEMIPVSTFADQNEFTSLTFGANNLTASSGVFEMCSGASRPTHSIEPSCANAPSLDYPDQTLVVGETLKTSVVSDASHYKSFTISPDLPAGLELNPITGEIVGAPLGSANQTQYTITALTDGASVQDSFNLLAEEIPIPSCVVDSFEDASGSDQNGSRTLEFCLDNSDDGVQITFDTSSSRTIVLNSVLFRAGDVTIDGGGLITLAAAEDVETRLLDVNGDLTLHGMKFEGGTAVGDGGAVHTSGNAIVSNSTFTNNQALEVTNPETNAEQKSDGGALYAENNIDIFGSRFEGNSAAWDGGAVHSQAGEISVESSVFESNHASHYGGGISLDDTSLTLTIRSSEFRLNTATGNGGAVFGDDDVYIFDSVFEENSADNDGGGVYADADIEIEGSLFDSNQAADDGGALYADSDIDTLTSSFINNHADDEGGAYYVEDNDTDVERSYFAYNSSGSHGGVASVDQHIRVTNSTFYKNESGGSGGVFYSHDDSGDDGYLIYNTFADNLAQDAAVLDWDSDAMRLFGNVFMGHVGPALVYSHNDTGFIDLGANVSSSNEPLLDHESSRNGVSASSVGLIAPGEPTISFRPEIRFSSPESMRTSVTGELADTARYSLNLPTVDQSGSDRSSLTFLGGDGSDGYMEVDIAPAGSFGGHYVEMFEPDTTLGLYEVNAANTSDSFDTWGGVFISEDNWTSSLELFSSVSQCEYSMNSTLVDPGLYNEYQYGGPSGLEIQNLRISCETDPVTIGSGTVIFESVREFEGSFFSQKLSAVISSGTPGDFRVSIGGNLGSDGSETVVDSGTAGSGNYAVTGGDSSDPILGYRSEYSFDLDETPGSAYSNGAGNSFLTKTDPVTAQADSTEVFEAQVWFVDYTTSEEATATTFASNFANAEFGCAIASVVDSTPDGTCQTQEPAAIPAEILPVDDSEQVLSFESFFPGATLTKGPGGFIAAPSPYAGPTVTDARVQNQELSISGTNLNLISSLILGDEVLDLEENEGAFFVSTSSVPAGTYQLQFVHGGGSVDTSFEVTIVEPEDDSGSAFWTTQISENEIKFYAKNIVGAGKVQFFHNGNEVAWVNAQDATDPKLRVISSGPMTGANYLVRTRELVSGKNVFEIYVDGERVLRRAQGN